MQSNDNCKKTIIMGAAGRDFHNFNLFFKDNPAYRVVAFTATQIPDIEKRMYPIELAGKLYSKPIPIYPETELTALIRKYEVDLVAFSYSDIEHIELMHKASMVMAEQADFLLIGGRNSMLKSTRPVIAVCAVRTGCGKSPTTRKIHKILSAKGNRVVVIRHPMPYGDLFSQEVQRFSSYDDFRKHRCTIEEREEYELLVDSGITVFAGIDYRKVLKDAEKEADIIIWDGGNNDTPFLLPDVHIVIFDPHRAGHETVYYPGETNMLMADIAIIYKVNTANSEQVEIVRQNIIRHAPHAKIILADSKVSVRQPEAVKMKKVLVVEDAPTLTHGGMSHGAGLIAAQQYGAAEIVDPRPFAVSSLKTTYSQYPHIGPVLPAMGYSPSQVKDLEKTINRVECDLVLYATPIELNRLLTIKKPALRVYYDYHDRCSHQLENDLLSLVGNLSSRNAR